MMAELDASFPKAEENKLKKKFPFSDSEAGIVNIEQRQCAKCFRVPPVCICIDCGGIILCKECDKMIHKGASGKNKKRHRTKDLSSHLDDARENGIVEEKLIDFDRDDGVEVACSVESKPTSFLLVDGSERLQVNTLKDVKLINEM